MIKETFVNTAFTKERQPDGTDVIIIDPYTGCQLQCPYCFQIENKEWSKPIFVNVNIADKLKQQAADIQEDIYVGSTCDPYMPLEETHHLTRRCLEVLRSCPNHVYITTKSDNGLILTDILLLKSFSTPPTVLMGLSNIYQAYKGNESENIHIANTLRAKGIDVWCFITPILPYIMDVDAIVKELNPSIPIYFDKLRVITDGDQDKKILNWIDEKFPQYHNAYLKILYESDLSYYQEIYANYKSDSRFTFLTDAWEA